MGRKEEDEETGKFRKEVERCVAFLDNGVQNKSANETSTRV